ncbi:MAG: DEAD/DEAH box helicase family protein [Flavobacteriales bacterium]|nr:DEAD/DEAH box helicase family protein [Flavobacteriales bacterium]MCB9198736.1 DEAD/DEAH box helicase family protein [Flavobacteriales bacterium]
MLENISSNFSFLFENFSDIAQLGIIAEKNLYSDPPTTISKLRLQLEYIAQRICEYEGINDDGLTQNDRLFRLKQEDIIPQRVLDLFHSIRISGNKAVHYNIGSEEEALLRLKQARNASIWFFKSYEDSDFKEKEFIKPEREENVKTILLKLESEISILKAENDALISEKQNQYKDETSSAKKARRNQSTQVSENLDISEAETRLIIDDKLYEQGWQIIPHKVGLIESELTNHAVEEYPTETGPVDYALFVDGKLLAMLEAKRKSVNPQNVLEQAKRYSKGAKNGVGNWNGYRVPFLYATNSEQLFHLDVRNENNRSREIDAFHTPDAIKEKYERDEQWANKWLTENQIVNPYIREYQKNAITELESEIIRGNRKLMVAMATGTGKTFTASNFIYRLLKSGKAKRILFLVDRKSLASQTVRSFSSFETPQGNKLHKEYEIYSQKFQRSEFEKEDFDNAVLPNDYLTKPDSSKTFIYVSTIQRMAINLYGKNGTFGSNEEDETEEIDNSVDIPIHAFDVIIADECHRGYTSRETNIWRNVLNHFDAIKIGLTATPAAHTVAYFGSPVFEYPYEKAVLEGYLVDYDPILIHSDVKIKGAFLKEGEMVGVIDSKTGKEEIHYLEDQRDFDTTEIEASITAPDCNRKILQELKVFTDNFEEKTGRFPKTLIFAVNDINNLSHSDRLVNLCKDVFQKGDDFVKKITGNKNVDRPLQRIREFRNRPEPKIVVTVDMLSTGVDIPALECIVFLRPVKSRILWEQMLGRGTRLCEDIHKDRFFVFDCFGGDLLRYFKNASKMSEKIKPDTVALKEVIERIYRNEDRDYNVKRLVKRMRRIEKTMSGEAYQDFAAFIPNGDIGKFADELPNKIVNDFIQTINILRDPGFQDLLINYKRPKKQFYVGYEVEDNVFSEPLIGYKGDQLKPEDYLKQFATYVSENKAEIDAFKIILERPQQWSTKTLEELKKVLQSNGFPVSKLDEVHKTIYQKELIDVISMIKHAVNEEEPLLTKFERVDNAISRAFQGHELSEDQQKWVEYLREHLKENLSIDEEDFRLMPVLESHGGWGKFKKVFGDISIEIIEKINQFIAA